MIQSHKGLNKFLETKKVFNVWKEKKVFVSEIGNSLQFILLQLWIRQKKKKKTNEKIVLKWVKPYFFKIKWDW